jgi:hypothetical protein
MIEVFKLGFPVALFILFIAFLHLYTKRRDERRAKLTPQARAREDEREAEIQEELRMW